MASFSTGMLAGQFQMPYSFALDPAHSQPSLIQSFSETRDLMSQLTTTHNTTSVQSDFPGVTGALPQSLNSGQRLPNNCSTVSAAGVASSLGDIHKNGALQGIIMPFQNKQPQLFSPNMPVLHQNTNNNNTPSMQQNTIASDILANIKTENISAKLDPNTAYVIVPKSEFGLSPVSENSQSSGPATDLTCDICGKTCKDAAKLRVHKYRHSKQLNFKCELCPKSFASQQKLATHMELHASDQGHTCSICNKVFNSKVHLDRHLTTHRAEKPHKCEVCEKAFGRKEHLKRHMLTHTGERPFQCTMCDKAFRSKNNLIAHGIRVGHNLAQANQIKQEENETEESMDDVNDTLPMNATAQVLATPMAPGTGGAQVLPYQMIKSEGQTTHQPLAQQPPPLAGPFLSQPLNGQQLGPGLMGQKTMQLNAPVHSKNSVSKPVIDAEIQQKIEQNLVQNLARMIQNNQLEGLGPSQAQNLTASGQHQSSNGNDGGKPAKQAKSPESGRASRNPRQVLACEPCGMEFPNKNAYNAHMAEHTGRKPYQCEMCDKFFNDKSSLCRHTMVHTGEKPYQCSRCEKTFSRRDHLQRHTLTHTGEKPHQCRHCPRWFKLKRDLVTHLESEHGEQPRAEKKSGGGGGGGGGASKMEAGDKERGVTPSSQGSAELSLRSPTNNSTTPQPSTNVPSSIINNNLPQSQAIVTTNVGQFSTQANFLSAPNAPLVLSANNPLEQFPLNVQQQMIGNGMGLVSQAATSQMNGALNMPIRPVATLPISLGNPISGLTQAAFQQSVNQLSALSQPASVGFFQNSQSANVAFNIPTFGFPLATSNANGLVSKSGHGAVNGLAFPVVSQSGAPVSSAAIGMKGGVPVMTSANLVYPQQQLAARNAGGVNAFDMTVPRKVNTDGDLYQLGQGFGAQGQDGNLDQSSLISHAMMSISNF